MKMSGRFLFLFLISLFVLSYKTGFSQVSDSVTWSLQWEKLEDGMFYCEADAPEKSSLNDSKITFLKLDPTKFDFRLLTASEHGRTARTADEWAAGFDAQVIVNAGMYNYDRAQSCKGYLKNYSHWNNPQYNGAYNVMMAIHPKDKSLPDFSLFDLTCTQWPAIQPLYHSFCQGLRMINCNGDQMAWNKRPWQACSMVICATDVDGNIYFIFTRSPYTHQTMIGFLHSLPIDIRTTVYLEGGPEASLFIQVGDKLVMKWGSFVSRTYENDDNDHFWKIPNVIAISPKK